MVGQIGNFGTDLMASAVETGLRVRRRPASIPPGSFRAVARWSAQGIGVRGIVKLLEDKGVFATKSSVSRLLLGQGAYRADC